MVFTINSQILIPSRTGWQCGRNLIVRFNLPFTSVSIQMLTQSAPWFIFIRMGYVTLFWILNLNWILLVMHRESDAGRDLSTTTCLLLNLVATGNGFASVCILQAWLIYSMSGSFYGFGTTGPGHNPGLLKLPRYNLPMLPRIMVNMPYIIFSGYPFQTCCRLICIPGTYNVPIGT